MPPALEPESEDTLAASFAESAQLPFCMDGGACDHVGGGNAAELRPPRPVEGLDGTLDTTLDPVRPAASELQPSPVPGVGAAAMERRPAGGRACPRLGAPAKGCRTVVAVRPHGALGVGSAAGAAMRAGPRRPFRTVDDGSSAKTGDSVYICPAGSGSAGD